MTAVVLDASAALIVLRDEPGSADVAERLRRAATTGRLVLVPPLFWLEVINALARRYRYPPESIVEAIYELEQAGITTADIGRPTTLAVVDAVGRYGLTAYDAAYLVLAESADAELMTGDVAVARAAGDRGVLVGAGGGIGEKRARYRSNRTWPHWRGAERYLRELRESVLAG